MAVWKFSVVLSYEESVLLEVWTDFFRRDFPPFIADVLQGSYFLLTGRRQVDPIGQIFEI
jgi:hypothetical protein